jgi:ankyrin repeat protein
VTTRAVLKCNAWLLQDGSTILHWAATEGLEEVVGQLLAAGAAVDVYNEVRSDPCAEVDRESNLAAAPALAWGLEAVGSELGEAA